MWSSKSKQVYPCIINCTVKQLGGGNNYWKSLPWGYPLDMFIYYLFIYKGLISFLWLHKSKNLQHDERAHTWCGQAQFSVSLSSCSTYICYFKHIPFFCVFEGPSCECCCCFPIRKQVSRKSEFPGRRYYHITWSQVGLCQNKICFKKKIPYRGTSVYNVYVYWHHFEKLLTFFDYLLLLTIAVQMFLGGKDKTWGQNELGCFHLN